MRTTIIRLEAHDDVFSTCDRMDWGNTGRILLVWPDGPTIIQRRLDLTLLLRHAQKLGAHLALACEDQEIRLRAIELGIPIFRSAAEAQRKPWRIPKARRRMSFEWLSEKAFGGLPQKAIETGAVIWGDVRLRYAIFALGVLAFMALGLVFLPGGRVVLPAAQQEQSLELAVWASPLLVTYNPSGGIPAYQRSITVEGQDELQSTGSAHSPLGSASGKVQFTNLTNADVKVPVGTAVLVLQPAAIRFLVTEEAIVPAGSGKSILAQVKAQDPGSASNVAAETIQAIEGSLGLKLLVNNPQSISGGSDQQGRSPSRADYAALEERLLKSLQDKALQELTQKAQTYEVFLPVSVKMVRILDEARDPPVDMLSNTAHLTLRVEYIATYYHSQDLQSVALIALDAAKPEGFEVIPNSLQVKTSQAASIDQGVVRWKVIGERKIKPSYSSGMVAGLAAGVTPGDARAVLEKKFGMAEGLQIETIPSWWPWMPLLPFRIEVVSQ